MDINDMKKAKETMDNVQVNFHTDKDLRNKVLDLLKQAKQEKSHFYVASVLEECLANMDQEHMMTEDFFFKNKQLESRIDILEKALEEYSKDRFDDENLTGWWFQHCDRCSENVSWFIGDAGKTARSALREAFPPKLDHDLDPLD